MAGFWLAAGIATAIAIVFATSIAIVLATTDSIRDKSISCQAVRPSNAFIEEKIYSIVIIFMAFVIIVIN